MYTVFPEVLLHEHLDGSLRVDTILELASEYGYRDLPTTDADGLTEWFDQGESESLESYLESFRHSTRTKRPPGRSITSCRVRDHAQHGQPSDE